MGNPLLRVLGEHVLRMSKIIPLRVSDGHCAQAATGSHTTTCRCRVGTLLPAYENTRQAAASKMLAFASAKERPSLSQNAVKRELQPSCLLTTLPANTLQKHCVRLNFCELSLVLLQKTEIVLSASPWVQE
jgi:hypothetical protein